MTPKPPVLGVERARHVHRRRRDDDLVPGRELGDHAAAIGQDCQVFEERRVEQRLDCLAMLGRHGILEVTAGQVGDRDARAPNAALYRRTCSDSASAITSSMSIAMRSRRTCRVARRSVAIFSAAMAETSVMATTLAATTATAPFSSRRPARGPIRSGTSTASSETGLCRPGAAPGSSCGRNDIVVTNAPPVPTTALRVSRDIKVQEVQGSRVQRFKVHEVQGSKFKRFKIQPLNLVEPMNLR